MKKLLLSIALITSGASLFGAANSASTTKQMLEALQTFKALLKEEIPKVDIVRPTYVEALKDLAIVEVLIQKEDTLGAQQELRRLEPYYRQYTIGEDGISLGTWMLFIHKGNVQKLSDL